MSATKQHDHLRTVDEDGGLYIYDRRNGDAWVWSDTQVDWKDCQ